MGIQGSLRALLDGRTDAVATMAESTATEIRLKCDVVIVMAPDGLVRVLAVINFLFFCDLTSLITRNCTTASATIMLNSTLV